MSTKRSTESEISEAVLKALAATHSGEATHKYLRQHVPTFISLTPGDRAPSETRDGEELWEQIVRNIKSHAGAPGNYITEGYLSAPSRGRLRLTPAGRAKVR